MNSSRSLRAFGGALFLAALPPGQAQDASRFDLRFVLLDAGAAPIAQAPVRLVVGSGAGWQAPGAGTRASTDAAGVIAWSGPVHLERRRRKLPTNFSSQLIASPQDTVHVAVAAELPFLGQPWLYVFEADLFPGGTTAQLDGVQVLGAGADGMYAGRATYDGGTWRLPGVPLVLNTVGYRVERFVITPRDGGHSIELHVQRLPEPVRR